MYAGKYVCTFFEDFSRLRVLGEAKVLQYDRVVDDALLRHVLAQTTRMLGDVG